MYKIRRIKFKNHSVLKNLELNFCGSDGKAVDTVLIAGENGTGKSTIIDTLYRLLSKGDGCEMDMDLETDTNLMALKFRNEPLKGENTILSVRDQNGNKTYYNSLVDGFHDKYPVSAIYSDVDINFNSTSISNVTSLTLDSKKDSRRSGTDLPQQIKQLIIDVQAIDDADLAYEYRQAKLAGIDVDEIKHTDRMERFTSAFNHMFDKMTYSRVENMNGKKVILFQKNGEDIPIDALSSGEKQVVYRGCFLLKDIAAINGAFVFIDEPEISLHPTWQMKIMDYYKGIFTNKDGIQTSQIFAVTHSPFIIHNDNRKNDKVIVLARDENGDIIVKDKPEYFKCNSLEAIQDAFSIQDFSAQKSCIYLEGRTDEKYFKKASEVYGYNNLPFEFKWVGHLDEKGQEANTGKEALNKAVSFLTGMNLSAKNVCLYDCDANKTYKEINNLVILSLPKFDNDKGINIGIENALVFGDIDIEKYKKQKVEVDGYGIEKRIPDFQKMECCEYICSLDTERLKQVFINLKTEIDTLIDLFRER